MNSEHASTICAVVTIVHSSPQPGPLAKDRRTSVGASISVGADAILDPEPDMCAYAGPKVATPLMLRVQGTREMSQAQHDKINIAEIVIAGIDQDA